MDGSNVDRNDASRTRLRSLVGSLSDSELARPLGGGWTVAAALAHLAWWDRYALASLASWEQSGTAPATGAAAEINSSALSDWLAMPPRTAAAAALEAAETIDSRVATLPGQLAEAVVAAGRSRLLERSLHRKEHLEQIEAALRSR